MADNTSNDKKIMDIQSPQNSAPTTDSSAVPQTTDVSPAPDEDTTTTDVAEESTSTPSTDDPTAADSAAPAAADSPLAVQMGDKTPHHRRTPVGAIIVALVVALILAGLTVYALKGTKKAVTPVSTATQKTTTPAATTTDVDQTNQDLDKSLKQVDDTKDLNTNDLSDATLGI